MVYIQSIVVVFEHCRLQIACTCMFMQSVNPQCSKATAIHCNGKFTFKYSPRKLKLQICKTELKICLHTHQTLC